MSKFTSFLKKVYDWTPLGLLQRGLKFIVKSIGAKVNDSVSSRVGEFVNNIQGSFGNILSNSGNYLESFLNQQTGAALTGAQQQANAFNAVEAEKQRQWQAEMDNTRYQRTVADMQEAGINPALAMSNGASATAPSGASASSVSPSAGMSMSDLMAFIALPYQIKNLEADVRLKDSAAEENAASAGLKVKQIGAFDRLTDKQIEEIDSLVKSRDVENELKKQGISESVAREELLVEQRIMQSIDNASRQELNRLAVELRGAQIANVKQSTAESVKRLELLQAQISELYQRAILEAAQANMFDESAQNLLVERGILQYDSDKKAFEVSHQKADRNWRIAFGVINAVTGLASSAGSVLTGAGVYSRAASSTARAFGAGTQRFHAQYSDWSYND